MEFQKINLNPRGWKTGDCVVRAIAKANNMSWEATYLGLCEMGAKKCRMPNDKQTYEAYLKELGWVKHKMPRHSDRTRYLVYEIIEELKVPMIISMAHHLTYSDGYTLYDLWNCSTKSVGNYWTREK